MNPIRFTWDERKSASNKRKHGVSFEEGQTVFSDDNALFMHDPNHSDDEDRFLLLGLSSIPRLLVVCHCYREETDTIRIISVWKAGRSETAEYLRRRGK
jgi:uncharacterized DUF497 family protein